MPQSNLMSPREVAMKSLMPAALLTAATLTTSCSPSYWNTLFNTSEAVASVSSAGKVEWKFDKTNTVWSSTRKAPVVQVSLTPGSSPVEIQQIAAQYVTPFNSEATGRAGFSYAATIQPNTPLNLTLSELITQDLLNASSPKNGDPPIGQIDVNAFVQFQGRNKLGQSIRWSVSVPISFSYVE